MGFRFRKSFKIAPGIRFNLNKKSAGISIGGKGVHYTLNTSGKRTVSAGIPGSGLYYTSSTSGKKSKTHKVSSGSGNRYQAPLSGGNNYTVPPQPGSPIPGGQYPQQPPQKDKTVAAIIWLIIFFPVGLILMWTKTRWPKAAKIIISAFFAVLFLIAIASSIAYEKNPPPMSSSGIISISIDEDLVRLETGALNKNHKTIHADYTADYDAQILDGDFIAKYTAPDIVSADISLAYSDTLQVEIYAKNPGTTKMRIESLDGTIVSNAITIEVIGEPETVTEAEPESEPETEPETEASTEAAITTTAPSDKSDNSGKSTSQTVYTTPTGSKYHFSKSCAGKNAIERSLDEVKDTYEPCKKCAQ